jgi:hypothetical protein
MKHQEECMAIIIHKPAGTLIAVLFMLLMAATDARPLTYTLTTTPDPIQGGMVVPNCSAGCLYDSGTAVRLLALPFDGYIFGGWSGDCAGSAPSTSLSMTAERECSADFLYCDGYPVEIIANGYTGLMAAYTVAGDGDTIEMLAANLQESPNLNRQMAVKLKGGYGCGFGANPSMTLLQGPLTVAKGAVTVENLIIVGPLSAAAAIAPSIPTLPDSSGFDTFPTDPAVTGDVTQIENGTTGNDRIVQYGGTCTVIEGASGNTGSDWVLQVCNGATCNQSADSGDGDDIVYQFAAGSGPAFQGATGGCGDGAQTFIQVGGLGVNTMSVDDSCHGGSAHIEQYGGPAGNTMEATGSFGNDIVAIYGGAGNDGISYDITQGSDVVVINGGGGADSLTINTQGLLNYTIREGSGAVLFSSGTGGSSITAAGVEGIMVLDQNGKPLFFWGIPPIAPVIPQVPAASTFDNVITNAAVTGDVTQTANGTPGKDLITQYGGTGSTTEIASGSTCDDWILQV